LFDFDGRNDGTFFDVNRNNEIDVIPVRVNTGVEVSNRSSTLNFGAQGLSVVLEAIPIEPCRQIDVSPTSVVNPIVKSR